MRPDSPFYCIKDILKEVNTYTCECCPNPEDNIPVIKLDRFEMKEDCDFSNIYPRFLRVVNEVHFSNMNKLEQMAKLDSDWNGYDSESISPEVIDNVKRTLDYLENKNVFVMWELFPTARNSIQLEVDFKGNYIEVEIFDDHLSLFIDGKSSIDLEEASLEFLVEILRRVVDEPC